MLRFAPSTFPSILTSPLVLLPKAWSPGVMAGLVVTDPDDGNVPAIGRWATSPTNAVKPTNGGYLRASDANGGSATFGAPAPVAASGVTIISLCWSWADRTFTSYSRDSTASAWVNEGR